MTIRSTFLPLLFSGLVGCSAEPRHAPPSAEFLIASGDSTFWVRSGSDGVRVRRSPILLTRYGGKFYELYVADDDRSFFDAVFIGQRIYRRDLVTGDSLAIFLDPTVPKFASAYAAAHPDERPLAPSEEGSDSPHAVATSETEILDVFGPYLTYEHHTDVDIVNGEDAHTTRRGVVDIARATNASLASIFGASVAARVAAEGRRALDRTIDSVRRARGARARRAAEAIEAFTFDSASFELADDRGRPVVAFVVPGRGERAGGLALPLPPVTAAGLEWWEDVRPVLPSPSADGDEWRGQTYDVLARYDSTGERLTLVLRDTAKREFSLGRLPAPARRVYRLDRPSLDSVERRALARAFDESVRYSDEARTAAAPPARPRIVPAVYAPRSSSRPRSRTR